MSAHNDVVDILGRLLHLARDERPDDRLLRSFLARFFRDLPGDDVEDDRIDEAYRAGVAQLELGLVRRPGETLVDVRSPDDGAIGSDADRSLLMFVADDVPFLVDSVRMVLERRHVGIHLLIHPMLAVERDETGRVRTVGKPDGLVEAWTLIEIDRCTPEAAEELRAEVHDAIRGVQLVVADFAAMRSRLVDVGGGDPLLGWLADGNFVFLGAVSYRRVDGELVVDAGSELGEFRSGRLDAAAVDPPPAEPWAAAPHATALAARAERQAGAASIVIARTDAVAEIHRPARMTSIAVRPPGTDVEHRIVGLLGAAAYRESVFAIPVVGDHARTVLARSGAPVDTYIGRALQNVVETLPRDLVFELDVDALEHLVDEIVGLQERPIVRVFDVAEPVGPWTTVLVYLPRARFDALLPDRVAALVGDHCGGVIRDVEVLLGTSSLARISLAVRAPCPDGVDDLIAAIDAASTTWHERVRRALVAELGEIGGLRVFAAVDPTVPLDYQASVEAEDAVDSLATVARLLAAPPAPAGAPAAVETALVRDGDRDGGVPWRFRVFLRDRPAAIAELVPILEHLGLSPIDERPFTFHGDGGTVHLYDLGVELDRTDLDPDHEAEIRRSFAGLLAGTIEADGLNRLILDAGLNGRQVGVLRLYNRYLRQVGFAFSTRYVEQALVRNVQIARSLIELFDARFDPTLELGDVERAARIGSLRQAVDAQLDAVPSLDDDRIGRIFVALIEATTRTNAFARPGGAGGQVVARWSRLRPQAPSVV